MENNRFVREKTSQEEEVIWGLWRLERKLKGFVLVGPINNTTHIKWICAVASGRRKKTEKKKNHSFSAPFGPTDNFLEKNQCD